ncbi:MAG: hypothetical protein WBP51_12870, partial [Candidatus Sulfotelmatobacter sp.]
GIAGAAGGCLCGGLLSGASIWIEKNFRSDGVISLESVTYGYSIGDDLAKILGTSHLAAKYSIQST